MQHCPAFVRTNFCFHLLRADIAERTLCRYLRIDEGLQVLEVPFTALQVHAPRGQRLPTAAHSAATEAYHSE